MIKAVVDVNVIISGVMSAVSPPGQILDLWDEGAFELVVSQLLIGELAKALTYPKIRDKTDATRIGRFVELMNTAAHRALDPSSDPPIQPSDPNDVYLVALALKEDAALVSGDRHLLDLRGQIPVFSPTEFLEYLARIED